MAAALSLDLNTGNTFEVTLTQSASSVALNNPTKGQVVTIVFIQNDAGGYTVSGWPANVKFTGSNIPIQSVGSGLHDTITLEYDGTNFHEISRNGLLVGRRLLLGGYSTPMTQAGLGGFTGTQTQSANAAGFGRFVPDEAISISKIGFEVITPATANDSIQVGILNAAGTIIASSINAGTAGLVNSGGFKTCALTAALDLLPGAVYYAGLVYGAVGGTAATLSAMNWTRTDYTTMFGANVPNQLSGGAASAYPFSTATAAYATLGTGSTQPLLVVMS